MRLVDARRWAKQLREERGYFVVVGRESREGYVVIVVTDPAGVVRTLSTAADVQAALSGKL